MRWMILNYYDVFGERANLRLAWLWGDPPILNCADKISNQNGFGRVHLLLLNFQWYLVWELQILLQDWPLKSVQIGNSRQFFRILQFKLTGLFECLRLIHKYTLSLLFHLKSWSAEKLNHATALERVYKQYLPRNVNITFALIEVHMRCSCKKTVKCLT